MAEDSRLAISRHDLIDRVLARNTSLVLFIAPAGFGKTTAMNQLRDALQSRGMRTAWWSLDRSDNDPQRLFGFLRKVLNSPAESDHIAPFGLNVKDDGPLGIFLDDFEVVEGGPLPEIVRNLLGQLPPGSRLVIGSRRKLSFGLAKLKLQGSVLEFDATDLQFTSAESSQLLRQATGEKGLSSSTLALLQEKTAGWPAAVALASIALTHQREGEVNLVKHLSTSLQPIEEYLSEVVLETQPQEVRDFLLFTSVLHNLDPALCKELVPNLNTDYMLERLISNNLFVSPVLGQVERWRYHPVFADILRLLLLRKRPNDYYRLHLSASGWYEAQNQIVPAIDHAIAGGDYPHAAKLLASRGMKLLIDGRLRLLSRWFAVLPIEELAKQPMLIPIRLWATTFTQGASEASRQLEMVADFWPGLEESANVHLAALKCTWLFMMDKPTEAGVVGMQALSNIPTSETYADNVVSVSMAILLVQDGKRDAANRLLNAVRQRQGDTAFMRMFIESAESEQDLQDGLLQQAKARLKIAVGATHSTSSAFDTTNGNAWAGVLYAFACYEAGQLDEAKKLLRVYSPVVQTMGSHDHLILALVCLSRIAREQGDIDESLDYLAELEHAGMARNLPRLTASAWLERSREHILAGHSQAATEAMLKANASEVWATDHQLRRLPHSALDPKICSLRWSLYFGDSRRALSEIDAELATSKTTGWKLRTLTLELLRAAALSKNGHESTALEQLANTLRFTAEQDMVRRVVDEGPLMSALVSKLLLREKNKNSDTNFIAYLQKLIVNAPRQNNADEAKHLQRSQATALLSPLTLKEQEVLSLLAEGYSNQALSDELGVSESTVRTHLRNINSKLDVTSRMQAVAKARQMGLLN